MSLKRSADEVAVGKDKRAKLDVNEEDLFEVRMVVHSLEVGTIIGKGGSNVNRIREEGQVYCSIVRHNQAKEVEERIMTIKGLPASIANGVSIVSTLLLEAKQARERKNNAEESSTTTSVRFLCHVTQVGAVIGKAGAIVRETIASTGARVSVSTEPLAGSTEKSITVLGTPDQIYAASVKIIDQLQQNPIKEGSSQIPYTPVARGAAFAGAYGAPPAQAPYNPYGQPAFQPAQYGAPQFGGAASYGQPAGYGAPVAAPAAAGRGDMEQKIVIPSVCAGNVIGRGGSIIADIRAQSGTFISIAKADPTSPDERIVTIKGSSQGIQTAVYLIRQVVEQYEGNAPAPQY